MSKISDKIFDYEVARDLAELGYNESCDYSYIKNTRVSDEICEKHPGLSDSGYMDLLVDYGGPYKRSEVYKTYVEPAEEYIKNSWLKDDSPFKDHLTPNILCACPSVVDVHNWLIETHNLFVDVHFNPMQWQYAVTTVNGACRCVRSGMFYEDYDKALLAGVEDAIKYLKETLLAQKN